MGDGRSASRLVTAVERLNILQQRDPRRDFKRASRGGVELVFSGDTDLDLPAVEKIREARGADVRREKF